MLLMPTAGKYKWPASSRERFANTNKIIKQLLNSVLVGYEELLRPWFVLSSIIPHILLLIIIIPHILLDLIQ